MARTTSYVPGTSLIDITAPGGIDALLAFHRRTFGDARMDASGGEGGEDGANDDGEPDKGSGDQADKAFPADTPVKDMTPEQQAAYWQHHARKHEDTVKGKLKTAGFTFDQLVERSTRLKELEDAAKSDEDKRAEREKELVSSNAELASKNAVLAAAVKYGLAEEDLAALEGVPADKVDAIAARLGAKKPKAPSADGQGGSGGSVHDKEDRSAKDIVDAATRR